MTMDDAYAIQQAWVARKTANGRTIRGHKVGLTSRAMQVSSNIDEPDFGTLLDDMFYADGDTLPISRFIVPRVEVELAFVLGRDLQGPGVTLMDVLRATDYVTPALEIIDARFHQVDPETKITRKVLDTISDNAANAALVIGGLPVRVDAVDLRWVGAALMRNGVVEETGVALGVLNHPGNGVAWLANKLALMGVGLKAGHVILSGSFTRPVYAKQGDVFCVDYGKLNSINCRFG
jgi:2-oxo-hept-3-ene-1,7-dioate hydratase